MTMTELERKTIHFCGRHCNSSPCIHTRAKHRREFSVGKICFHNQRSTTISENFLAHHGISRHIVAGLKIPNKIIFHEFPPPTLLSINSCKLALSIRMRPQRAKFSLHHLTSPCLHHRRTVHGATWAKVAASISRSQMQPSLPCCERYFSISIPPLPHKLIIAAFVDAGISAHLFIVAFNYIHRRHEDGKVAACLYSAACGYGRDMRSGAKLVGGTWQCTAQGLSWRAA